MRCNFSPQAFALHFMHCVLIFTRSKSFAIFSTRPFVICRQIGSGSLLKKAVSSIWRRNPSSASSAVIHTYFWFEKLSRTQIWIPVMSNAQLGRIKQTVPSSRIPQEGRKRSKEGLWNRRFLGQPGTQ